MSVYSREAFANPEARARAEELFERMTAENEQQLNFDFGDRRLADSKQAWLRERNPGLHVIPTELFYRYQYLAALSGAGFTEATEPSEELQEQIRMNDDAFRYEVRDVIGGIEGFSYRTWVLPREAYVEALAHAYHVVGKVSIMEVLDKERCAEALAG